MRRAELLIAFEALMVIGMVVGAILIARASLAPPVATRPSHHVNRALGLTVPIPSDMRLCMDAPRAADAKNHWLLLDAQVPCRDGLRAVAHIDIGGTAEPGLYADSVGDVAAIVCHRFVVDMPDIEIPGHKTVVCQEPYLTQTRDGTILDHPGRIKTTAMALTTGVPRVLLRISLVGQEKDWPRDVLAFKRVLASVETDGRARDFAGTALARCPDFDRFDPAVAEVEWSVRCFLHALKTQDRELVAALAPRARCSRTTGKEYCIDGIIDRGARDAFFGRSDASHRPLSELIAPLDSVVVNYTFSDNEQRWVAVLLGPDKGIVNAAEGWKKDYFDCMFDFDKDLGIWVPRGLCRTEDSGTIDSAMTYDFTGADRELKRMVWRP